MTGHPDWVKMFSDFNGQIKLRAKQKIQVSATSFATWNVLLPSGEAAKRLAGGNITTRFFRLQPEYRGKRRIKVTVCNVSMQLSGDVLTAYLSIYGGVEQVTQITSNSGTAYDGYVFITCLDRGGFNNIPHIIKYRDQSMMVVVEGRRPLCRSSKQLRHFSRTCPQKTMTTTTMTATTTATTTSPTTTTTTATEKTTAPTIKKIEDHPNKKDEEGWIQVTRKVCVWGGGESPPPNSPNKQIVKTTKTTVNTVKTTEATESTTKSPAPIIEEKIKTQVSSNKKKKKKQRISEEEHVPQQI